MRPVRGWRGAGGPNRGADQVSDRCAPDVHQPGERPGGEERAGARRVRPEEQWGVGDRLRPGPEREQAAEPDRHRAPVVVSAAGGKCQDQPTSSPCPGVSTTGDRRPGTRWSRPTVTFRTIRNSSARRPSSKRRAPSATRTSRATRATRTRRSRWSPWRAADRVVPEVTAPAPFVRSPRTEAGGPLGGMVGPTARDRRSSGRLSPFPSGARRGLSIRASRRPARDARGRRPRHGPSGPGSPPALSPRRSPGRRGPRRPGAARPPGAGSPGRSRRRRHSGRSSSRRG